MKKITLFFIVATFVCTAFATYAQTPEWFRENTLLTSVSDQNALATDTNGNVYCAFRYTADGELIVLKLDTDGNILWNTHFADASQTNIRGAKVLDNGGTDFLYLAFDSQTVTVGQQQIGLACLDLTTGTAQWFYDYTDSGTSRNVRALSSASDGSLMITADDVILFLDKDGNILSQYGTSTITFNRQAADLSGVSSLTLNDTNTETNMPFSVGSPLANTPAPTGPTYNAEQEWVFGTTFSSNDPVNGEQYDITSATFANGEFTGGSSLAYKASILNNDGFYIHANTTLAGNSQQAIVKLDETDRSTVEWAYTWPQTAERAAMLDDENGNIYVITWDNLFFLNSNGGIDILITKFDKDGNLQWSKVYGNGTNAGNDVIWRNSSTAIDRTNGRILINSYTDSFDTSTPKGAMLVINYDGELQNYTIVGEDGATMFPIGVAVDGNGNIFGAGTSNTGGGAALIYKVGAATVFDGTLSNETITEVNDGIRVIVKENGASLALKGAVAPEASVSLYDIIGRVLFNGTASEKITGLNLKSGQIYLLRYESPTGNKTIKFTF